MKTSFSILIMLGLGLPMLNAAPPVAKPVSPAVSKAVPTAKVLFEGANVGN